MTPDDARREYALHADDAMRIDLTTICFWLALGLLSWLLLIAAAWGVFRLARFLGGLIFS
jgi:hypothetical protein